MEELMKNLYLFLTEAERGDVLRIHVTETDECYEFSYDEVMDNRRSDSLDFVIHWY